ncbi:bifunctional aminoglycoside phosphotransferase/ATP-binding protein [Paraburkholderia ferrariae]|uniref:bifunctional aminoglycoside phosphotransferase/ATP-binding protein n=1 Tax=Paraburkholderia ferrariae TaxID=386056 RepID=UPI0005A5E4A9|nr:bifunctional aminoglycoside phosphotransferase/ATP-binding protein [Paraburkholderia ferrariae]
MSRSPHVPFVLSGGPMRRNARLVGHALRRAATYPHPAGRVERIETHLSVVYLAGRYAYKILKPVKFSFVDLTRPAQRRRCAQAEYAFNQALAAPLYLGVWRLVARGRRGTFAGALPARPAAGNAQATALEYVVRMRRFAPREVLSARSARGEEALADADRLAARLAHYHLHAARRAPHASYGSAATVADQARPLVAALDATVPAEAALRTWCERELARIAPKLAWRHANGFVRACHGDLHLDNIVQWRHQLLMFDCIEFDDALRWIDVASDSAFAIMDFAAHGREDCAHRLLCGWLAATGDYASLHVMPFYMVYRALVRALAARLRGDGAAHARYLRVATDIAGREPRASLLLCHGVSGSGKSVASRALAGRLGAIRLSSDAVRKRLAAVSETVRLPHSAYTAERLDAVYDALLSHAQNVLESGRTAIVDATFLHARHRAEFVALAQRSGVPVAILDFTADLPTLRGRIAARAALGRDPSDADVAVLASQIEQAEPLSATEAALAIRFDTAVAPAAYAGAAFWAPLLDALGALGKTEPALPPMRATMPGQAHSAALRETSENR